MLAIVVAACSGDANDARATVPPADTTNEPPTPAAPEPESNDGTTPEPSAGPEPSATPAEPAAPPDEPASSDLNDVDMERLFDDYCVGCHADAASATWMILEGWIVPGFPDRSPMYQVVALPEGSHVDQPWPGDDDVLRICVYVDRQGGLPCTPADLAELRSSLD